MAGADAPLVVVADEDGTWPVVEGVVRNHLPLRRLHPPATLEAVFKVRDRQRLVMENVPLQFKPSTDPAARPGDHDRHRRHADPYMYLYVLNCESKRRSAKDLRTLATKWAEGLRAAEFLIVLVTPSLHRATVFDKKLVDHAELLFSRVEEKLKPRFKHRVVRLSSEQEVMHRIGDCLVASFDRLLQAYEEDTVRSLEVKATQPINWNFCSQYFPIREGFAAMLLQFNLANLALLVYLNMETMLGKLQGNAVSFTAVTTPQQLQRYTQPDRAPLMFQLSPQTATECRSAIRMSQMTELGMRIFLMAVIMRLSFAAQEHLTFLGRFGSRLAGWVELVQAVPGVGPSDVALFEAAAHISLVKELEAIVNAGESCAIPFSPTERWLTEPVSGEFPHMTQFAGIARQDSLESIGEVAVVVNDSVLMQPESSEDSDPYTPPRLATGLSTPASAAPTATALQHSPWATASVVSVASLLQTPAHPSSRPESQPEAPLQGRRQCYAAMATSLGLAQSRTVAAGRLMGLSLEALRQPPTHVSVSGGATTSRRPESETGESTSQRSFVRQYMDLTRAARDYAQKAHRPGVAQQMAYELALLCAQHGQHEEAVQCLTAVLQYQHRSPWPAFQYRCRLYLRNCCSHLLAAPADGDFAAWAAHRVWAPYLRCALWLAGRRPAAPPAGPAPLVPALPRHPHRPHPADPPAAAAPAGGDAAADPAQAEAWRIVREGLAACPTQPFTGTLSAVVDLVSLRVRAEGPVRPFEPFAAEVTMRSRIPEEVAISHATLTLHTAASPASSASAPVSTSKAVAVPLHLKRPTHGSSHSFDLSFTDGPRHQHPSAQFRSVSCNPTVAHAPRSPEVLHMESATTDDDEEASEGTSRDSAGVVICLTTARPDPIVLRPGVDTVLTVTGQADHEGWYRAATLMLDCQDLPLSLVEGLASRDEFAYCDTGPAQPPLPSRRLTGVQLPANYSEDLKPWMLPVFGQTTLKNFQVHCAEDQVDRIQLHAASPEDGDEAVPGGAGCLPLFAVAHSWSSAKGPSERWTLGLRARPLQADAVDDSSDFFAHLKVPDVVALYRAEDVERASDGFRRALGAAEGPGPVGTARAALEDGLLRLGEFALAAPCPRLCVPLQVPLDPAWLSRIAVVEAEFSFRADGPAATDQIEVVVPDSLPVSGLVGSSHAVSLGADVWVTCHVRHTGRLPVRFLGHRLTPPARFALHTTKVPPDLGTHPFSVGEEMNCVFGIAPAAEPPNYAVPGQLVLRYVIVRGAGQTSPEATLTIPIEIRHRLPPVLSPGYKVCVTLTSNTGDFQAGMTYPLDIYVFSRAEANQVNGAHHLVDVEIDVTVAKGRTPWMTIGTLTQRLILHDGKGRVQIHLLAMRGGRLPLPTVQLFSVPVHGLKRVPLATDLECPFHEVLVVDATPAP